MSSFTEHQHLQLHITAVMKLVRFCEKALNAPNRLKHGRMRQVLEAILDDDQDMQDMYLARRAEMAEMIAPDPDYPPDDPADPGLANLPSMSSSGVAQATLAQALQSVAASQEVPQEAVQEAMQHAAQEGVQEAADREMQKSSQEGGVHQWQRQGSGSRWLSEHPLEMAVPDQASLLVCLAGIMPPGLQAVMTYALAQLCLIRDAKTQNLINKRCQGST